MLEILGNIKAMNFLQGVLRIIKRKEGYLHVFRAETHSFDDSVPGDSFPHVFLNFKR